MVQKAKLAVSHQPKKTSTIRIDAVSLKNRNQVKTFVRLPYEIYRNDDYWIPKLDIEYLGNRLLGQIGLLEERHPYHAEATSQLFLAYKANKLVGRISASIDRKFNNFQKIDKKHTVGSFGFFECVRDQQVANALLDTAMSWCMQNGAKEMWGPLNFSTNHTCGLLIEGHNQHPFIDMPYNPPWYQELLENCGLSKKKDLLSFSYNQKARESEGFKKICRVADKIRRRWQLKTRKVNAKHLKAEVEVLACLYNDTWAANWGFVPIGDKEAEIIAAGLAIILDPELCRFAEVGDETVGVILTVPDLNWALQLPKHKHLFYDRDWLRLIKLFLKRHKIPGCRTILFGTHPNWRTRGLDALLMTEVVIASLKRPFIDAEIGWMLEDNEAILRICHRLGAKPAKIHRIYATDLC